MFAETTIKRWDGIQKFFASFSKSPGWIFRGHADAAWPLNTSLQRTADDYKIRSKFLPIVERIMLERFQSVAHHYLQYSPKDSDRIEWLSILQHHGGITRLLDCTRSFYVALYFALESSVTRDACAWCISMYKLLKPANDGLGKWRQAHATSNVWNVNDPMYYDATSTANSFVGISEFNTNVVIPVMPQKLNTRMSIQQGIFLFATNLSISFLDNLYAMLGASSVYYESFDYLRDDCDDYYVIKLIIPHGCHKEIIDDLERMNINAASLFPGLDGYARSLKYSLRIFDPAGWGITP